MSRRYKERPRALGQFRGFQRCRQTLTRRVRERARLLVEMGGGDRTRGNSSSWATGSCDTQMFIIHHKTTKVTTRWNGALG